MVKFMSSMKSMAVSLHFTTRLQTFICNHPHGWFLLLSALLVEKQTRLTAETSVLATIILKILHVISTQPGFMVT